MPFHIVHKDTSTFVPPTLYIDCTKYILSQLQPKEKPSPLKPLRQCNNPRYFPFLRISDGLWLTSKWWYYSMPDSFLESSLSCYPNLKITTVDVDLFVRRGCKRVRDGAMEGSCYSPHSIEGHTVRNLHFLSKNSTLILRKKCRFFFLRGGWTS